MSTIGHVKSQQERARATKGVHIISSIPMHYTNGTCAQGGTNSYLNLIKASQIQASDQIG